VHVGVCSVFGALQNAYVFTASANSAILSMSHCKQDLTHYVQCSA
jgi:hypothetical protein